MDENEDKCKCSCFCSAANANLMEAAIARYSDRSSFANNQAQDTATLLNANFQAQSVQMIKSNPDANTATLMMLLNSAIQTPGVAA